MIAYALSYMTGAAQNWAMPILQALDEGCHHDLLINYDVFRESVIAVYGDLDRRSNAEDWLERICQSGLVASYISLFNEHTAQVDWNEASLMAWFRGGLKDDVLDSIATTETQPSRLQEWMAMASRINERLWSRRQSRRPPFYSSNSRDRAGRSQVTLVIFGPVPMEIDALRGPTTAMVKTPAERLEYQRQGRCWGCGQLGHVRARCPTNPSTFVPCSHGRRGGNWRVGKKQSSGLRPSPWYPGTPQTAVATIPKGKIVGEQPIFHQYWEREEGNQCRL